jgi:hypothetical protein
MIKADFDIIDSIRELINLSDVSALVDYIRPFESPASDYTNRKKFIVVGFQSGNADDLQKGTVNVNVYAPDDNAGNADVTFFKNVEPVLIGILKDAYYDDMEIDLAMTPKTMRDMDVEGYHFLNIRVNIFYPSITT